MTEFLCKCPDTDTCGHADPTREQIDESSVHSDKSLLALSREELVQRVYDLERLHRSVRMYGVGYVLKHGTGRIQLNPLDVTVVLNADQPETEAEVRSRLAEMETVLAESDIDVSYRQRLLDEAKQQVQVLQDRIAKVREALHIADDDDRTDWQRGYRAAAERGLAVLDGVTP